MAKLPLRWSIAHIDMSELHFLNSELRKHTAYEPIEAYIPTINILKKKLKGKNHFDQIPLLFNYGFFRVPKYFITNPHFMDMMKKDIKCIHSWMTDPIVVKTGRSIDSTPFYLSNPKGIALATDMEIARIKLQERRQSIYSAKDIDLLTVGMIITLKKYPFDGLSARITEIQRDKQKVLVEILLGTPMTDKPISVSFDNIFYSAYQDSADSEMREQSIESIQAKYKNFEGHNDDGD